MDARRERWRAHREARRAGFVEAAIRAIGKHGLDVGMDDIAAEAGVTKPVVYRHFTDKTDLYLAVGERGTDLLMERLVPALADDGTPIERIRRAVAAYYSVLAEYPELYRFIVRGSFAGVTNEQNVERRDRARISTVLAQLLRAYMDLFGTDIGPAEPWAHGMVGMVQSAGDWWLDHPGVMELDTLTGHVATVLWHAIDGMLRDAGVTLDPNAPLTLEPQLEKIVGS